MLSETDAQLMALKQSIKLSRARLKVAIDKLEDMPPRLSHPSQLPMRDCIADVILDLKYTIDFLLGEPTT